jgi:hypothetical protein
VLSRLSKRGCGQPSVTGVPPSERTTAARQRPGRCARKAAFRSKVPWLSPIRSDRPRGWFGKEANRVESGRVFGSAAVDGKAKTHVDLKRRLLRLGRAEAKALGTSRATVTRRKRSPRAVRPS